MNLTRQQIQKRVEQNSILEFIWNSAKANPKWTMRTAKILADMHGLDTKEVYRLGKEAKYKSSFKARDWDILRAKVKQ
jgi:hypothetical protein